MKRGKVNFSVKASSLSCLLNRDSSIELLPEPFRLQGHVVFHVAYSEYVNYIQSLDALSPIVLSTELNTLKTLVASQSPQLYLHFLKDVAFAIMKEVWFAETYKVDGTIILPEGSGKPVALSDLLQAYNALRVKEDELKRICAESGYPLNRVTREHNVLLQRLAVCLYGLATSGPTAPDVSLVYDLM